MVDFVEYSDDDVCPRCGCKDFDEIDCGPDTYDDDITYTSYKCTSCGLWWDGWVDKWYIDVECWRDVEYAEEYVAGGRE